MLGLDSFISKHVTKRHFSMFIGDIKNEQALLHKHSYRK